MYFIVKSEYVSLQLNDVMGSCAHNVYLIDGIANGPRPLRLN